MQRGAKPARTPHGQSLTGENESQTRVFVRSEPHAALGEIATRLLSLTTPPSDLDIEHTLKEVQDLEHEVGLVTARGCFEEALQCLHKSRVVLSQCYEDKGKFLPHPVRKAYETLEDKFVRAIGVAGAGRAH